MGRYYDGDIEGKFWFAVQSSNDASFFGGSINEPNYIDYHFEIDEIKTIEKGIKTCEKELGKYKKPLDRFFKKAQSYNDDMLVKLLKVDRKKVRDLLTWLARLELGKKIYKCVKKTGECNFEAEL